MQVKREMISVDSNLRWVEGRHCNAFRINIWIHIHVLTILKSFVLYLCWCCSMHFHCVALDAICNQSKFYFRKIIFLVELKSRRISQRVIPFHLFVVEVHFVKFFNPIKWRYRSWIQFVFAISIKKMNENKDKKKKKKKND